MLVGVLFVLVGVLFVLVGVLFVSSTFSPEVKFWRAM